MSKKIPCCCGKYNYNPNSDDCKCCSYFEDDYCNYWDIHSSNDCPYCHGTGYDLDGGQCEECYGTGEIQ